MDRCVLLVDAGYLFAQGGLVVHGTKSRRELVLDAAKFVTDISDQDSKKLARRSFWTRVKAAAAAAVEEPGD